MKTNKKLLNGGNVRNGGELSSPKEEGNATTDQPTPGAQGDLAAWLKHPGIVGEQGPEYGADNDDDGQPEDSGEEHAARIHLSRVIKAAHTAHKAKQENNIRQWCSLWPSG